MSADKSTRTPRGRLPLTVTVGDGTSPSPVSAGKVPYLTDTFTPKTRRVSKLPAAEVPARITETVAWGVPPSCVLKTDQ